ncbi:MAG: hypothetical protein BWX89_00486 [candidate division TA06 bacterium ADurb.Bin131]|uniref:HEAT repeat protein n=1 Tax=candidate division TA06 bacterium ADurb.Bin131 TaxID=1852827 RepID=A0A1V6CCL5_UNCT6|nr:MAG: hypothetical protein BWX89_00486 [candidate division TA06 bacterium ADurb.Bin131]
MERIKNFYRNLNKTNRIIFWITFAVILFSVFSIVKTIYRTTTSKNPQVETYLKQIKSKDAEKRQVGVYMAGLYRIKEMVDTLEDVIKTDPDSKVRKVAAWSLGRIDINRLVKLLDSQDKDVKEITMETLIKLDKNNVTYLMERFKNEDTETKKKILDYVQKVKNPMFNDKIMEIAENTNEDVGIRTMAFNILKDTGTSELEGRLNSIYYNDPSSEMKELAKQTLDVIKNKEKIQ